MGRKVKGSVKCECTLLFVHKEQTVVVNAFK